MLRLFPGQAPTGKSLLWCDARHVLFTVYDCVVSFSVGTIILWNYIRRGNRYMAKIAMGLAVTVVACGELSLYGTAYQNMEPSFWLDIIHGGALASVSWLMAFYWRSQ